MKGCRDSEKRERTQEQRGEGKDTETLRKEKEYWNSEERERNKSQRGKGKDTQNEENGKGYSYIKREREIQGLQGK